MTTTGSVKEWVKFVIAEMYRAEEYPKQHFLGVSLEAY